MVWLGPDPLPAEFEPFLESWRRHHPDWELKLWGEDNLPADLRRAEVYDTERQPVERADILRLELIWRFGGVYVDTDFECYRPIDELIEGADFFTGLMKREAPKPPEEAPALASVSTRTMYRWVESGRVHFLETPEGRLLVCRNSLG